MATRRKKRGRKPAKRRTRKTAHHISPMAHLARKVNGLDTRVNHLESATKRFVKRKGKKHRLGTLEARGASYWGTGE